MNKYAIEIFYSKEDEGYIAVAPELPKCSAFGDTEEEALKEIKIAIELWLETAKKDRREVPKPAGRELLRTAVEGLRGLEPEVRKESAWNTMILYELQDVANMGSGVW